MNSSLKKIYVAIYEGKVVFFDTNLKAFVEKLKVVEPEEERSLSTFQRLFKKKEFESYVNEKGKIYLLQRLDVN